VKWLVDDPLFGCAEVEFGGIRREVQMACVRSAKVGDYVIVHAGIAICIVDEKEAQQTLEQLACLSSLDTDDEVIR
jgi:hydrogenase expression/formation protein HypC